MKTLTYDEADINTKALLTGRNALIAAVQRLGIRDLNHLSEQQFEHVLSVFLLAYNGHVARDVFGTTLDVKACLGGGDVPF